MAQIESDDVSQNRTLTEQMRPLPPRVVELLRTVDAPPRLLAHLLLVHDVAAQLADAVGHTWPRLAFDQTSVTIGAATHDIGKALHRDELTGPGEQHVAAGTRLLEEHGFTPQQARYARTHQTWDTEPSITVEDLLVALADRLWRGTRDATLELALTQRIATAVADAPWAVYMDLDDIASALAQAAPVRLSWLAQFDA